MNVPMANWALGRPSAKRAAFAGSTCDQRARNEHPQGIVTGVAGLRQKLNSDLGDPRCRGGLNLAKKDGKAQTTPQRQSRANIKMVVLRSGERRGFRWRPSDSRRLRSRWALVKFQTATGTPPPSLGSLDP